MQPTRQLAQIGKYANIHGAAAASHHLSRKLKHPVSESTVKSIRKIYQEEVSKRKGIFIKTSREEKWKNSFTSGRPRHKASVILKGHASAMNF